MFKMLLQGLKKVGQTIGKIQTTLIFSLLYYFLITPVGIIVQLVKAVSTMGQSKQLSYWVRREPKKDSENIFKQF